MAKPVNPGPKHHIHTFGADVWPGDTTIGRYGWTGGELFVYTADLVWVPVNAEKRKRVA